MLNTTVELNTKHEFVASVITVNEIRLNETYLNNEPQYHDQNLKKHFSKCNIRLKQRHDQK